MLDFPPRLTMEVGLQELFRQEFHRVSARMGLYKKKKKKNVFSVRLHV